MSKDKRTIPVPASAPPVKAVAVKLPAATWTDPETGVVGCQPSDVEEDVVQKALIKETERALGPKALAMMAAYRRGIWTRAELGRALLFNGLGQ